MGKCIKSKGLRRPSLVPSSRKLKRLVFVVAAALEYTGVLRAVTYVIQDDQRVPLTIESPASQFFYAFSCSCAYDMNAVSHVRHDIGSKVLLFFLLFGAGAWPFVYIAGPSEFARC